MQVTNHNREAIKKEIRDLLNNKTISRFDVVTKSALCKLLENMEKNDHEAEQQNNDSTILKEEDFA